MTKPDEVKSKSWCRACRKWLYEFRSDARVIVKSLRKAGRVGASRLNEYRCPDRDGWHVGHSSRRAAKPAGSAATRKG